MPRKTDDLCMLCTEEEPCEIHKPKEKTPSKPRKKKAPAPAHTPSSPGVTTTTPAPVDLKAAMQAAASQAPKPTSTPPPSVPSRAATAMQAAAQTENERASTDCSDTEAAINNLEPILHPDEKAKYADILNRPDNRAARWKSRNRGNDTPT